MTRPWGLALVLALAGCAGVSTDYDYDPAFPFADLETYGWKHSSSEKVMDPFVVGYVEAAVHRGLAQHGFRRSEAPDFLVVLRDEFEDRLAVDQHTRTFVRHVDARDLHKDDLIIQILDASSGELVWRGVASNVIDGRASAEARRASIERAVSLLLQDFPPR